MLVHVHLANDAYRPRKSATNAGPERFVQHVPQRTGKVRRAKLQDREQKKFSSLSRKRRGGGYSACNDDRLFIAIQSELTESGSARRDGSRSTWLRWTEHLHTKVDYRFFVTKISMNVARNDDEDVDKNLESELDEYGDVVVHVQEQLQPRSSWNKELWSLQWTQSSEFQNFSAFLILRDDSLLCIHRVVEELALRPDHRFVWGRYSCTQHAPNIDSRTSDNVNSAHHQLNKGFLAFTRDVAAFLGRLHHVPLDLDTLFPFLELTILDDQKRLVDEQTARLWLEDVSTPRRYGRARRRKVNFCQRFVWVEAIAGKVWKTASADREEVHQEIARPESASLVKYDAIEKLVSRFWRSYHSSAINRDANATISSNWTNITVDTTTHAADNLVEASGLIAGDSELFGDKLDGTPETSTVENFDNIRNRSVRTNRHWPNLPGLQAERLAPPRSLLSPNLQSDSRGRDTRNRETDLKDGHKEISPQLHTHSNERQDLHDVRTQNGNRMSRGVSLHENFGFAYSHPYNEVMTPHSVSISPDTPNHSSSRRRRRLGDGRHRGARWHVGEISPLRQARFVHERSCQSLRHDRRVTL